MQPTGDTHSFLGNESDWLPTLSVDCVIVGFHDNELKVLLLTVPTVDGFVLPGGLVGQHESIDAAARRVLQQRTGLTDIFLEQFSVFGQPDRGNADFGRQIARANGVELPVDHWFTRRFVSVGYYALVDFAQVAPPASGLSESVGWYDIRALPPLLLDHGAIIQKALETLRLMLDHRLIGFQLLPDMFTMADLQRLYETILGRPLLRANFQRKMLGMAILERIDKKRTGGAHKAPYLYRFIQKP